MKTSSMKKTLYAFAALIIIQFSFNNGEAHAQSWQWAKRGQFLGLVL